MIESENPSKRFGETLAAGGLDFVPPGIVTGFLGPNGAGRLDGVTKTCQSGAPTALAQISMGVAAGEVVAVMGPSGCGKSTPTIQPRPRRDIMHPMFTQLFLGTDDLAAEDDRRRRARRPGRTRPAMIIRPAGNRENRPRP